jgi:cytochrome c oxidase subunit IV
MLKKHQQACCQASITLQWLRLFPALVSLSLLVMYLQMTTYYKWPTPLFIVVLKSQILKAHKTCLANQGFYKGEKNQLWSDISLNRLS